MLFLFVIIFLSLRMKKIIDMSDIKLFFLNLPNSKISCFWTDLMRIDAHWYGCVAHWCASQKSGAWQSLFCTLPGFIFIASIVFHVEASHQEKSDRNYTYCNGFEAGGVRARNKFATITREKKKLLRQSREHFDLSDIQYQGKARSAALCPWGAAADFQIFRRKLDRVQNVAQNAGLIEGAICYAEAIICNSGGY